MEVQHAEGIRAGRRQRNVPPGIRETRQRGVRHAYSYYDGDRSCDRWGFAYDGRTSGIRRSPRLWRSGVFPRAARFFVTEIIREKILLDYDQEIPYAVQAIVEKFDETEDSIHIMAVIYAERDSQKAILIGKGGTKLKRVGIEARKDIEAFFQKRVYLEMFVKVEKDWRNRENILRSFGYIE